MLEKSPGNFQVDKLWIILLFEANFNQLNKHIGCLMMYHAEQYGLVSGEQYGSRHGHSSITQSLNKRLTFDHICQLKQAAIICSNNAKSCYDHIVHRIAAQSMYRCGVNKPALICMFSTIQRLRHHIRTLFGDSQISAGTESWAVPISEIGQGNGAGPQIWAVVSTPFLTCYERRDLEQDSNWQSVGQECLSWDTHLSTTLIWYRPDQQSIPLAKRSYP